MELKVQIADDQDHCQDHDDDHIEQPIGLAGRSDEDRQMLNRRRMYRVSRAPPADAANPATGASVAAAATLPAIAWRRKDRLSVFMPTPFRLAVPSVMLRYLRPVRKVTNCMLAAK